MAHRLHPATLSLPMLRGLLSLNLLIAVCPVLAEEIEPPAQPRNCPLCELPNRAAVLSGLAKKCPANCAQLCCTGDEVVYQVSGIDGTRTAQRFRQEVVKLEGVEVVSLSLTGIAVLRYDSDRLSPARLRKALAGSGFAVEAEQVALHIPTLNDEAAAKVVEGTLVLVDGVTRIETACPRNRQVLVRFDPARTTRVKLVDSLAATTHPVSDEG